MYSSSKPHYPILDGLRGVAALMVVIFHVFEAFAASFFDQIVNHGYLAVDFFFLLSGYVIGYAYDDRWKSMSFGAFAKRRLIRLQPMVIMGMLIGGALFYFQDSSIWPGISDVPVWKMLTVMVVGFTILPVPLSWDIRGWTEMHPLNGPGWSLFFEYIGNILYGLFVRKFSNTLLTVLVVLAGGALVHLAVTSPYGNLVGGWSLDPAQLRIGFTRMAFPFFAGLLLSRTVKITNIKNAFLWCSLLIVITLSLPRFGGEQNLWVNGLYDSLIVILVFPVIVYVGASGDISGKTGNAVCKFLGDISYPIYITHYPLIYTYTAWVKDNKVTLEQGWPAGVALIAGSVLLAYGCLKLYDIPVRKWLTERKILADR